MPKCSYCLRNFEFPHGMIVVNSVSGAVKNFCSSKCRIHAERVGKRRKSLKKKPWVTKKYSYRKSL